MINVDISLIEKVSNTNNKLNIVLEHLRNHYSNHIHIYCDGAKNRHTGATGFGFYDITNNNQYKAKTNTHLDIDSVELAAVSYSTKFVNSNYTNRHSLIITDSLRTCRRLKTYSDNDSRLDLISAIHKFSHNVHINNGSLSILWIPSHIGLYGHDQADKLAKEGINCNNYHDIYHDMKEIKRIVESAFTIPNTQLFWNNARTGTHGSRVIPNFFINYNINNFTKIHNISHLLFRMIFGTAEFHIGRNRGCVTCNANFIIDNVILNLFLLQF